ncbi:MAG: flagellin [Planctomycetota bacterium]
MARINTNVPSLIAQNQLTRSYADLSVSMERLSTGLRINRGADDPAGLITSERLRSEISGINKAISNSERAASVIATTEGALHEVAELLNSAKGLVVEAANSGGRSKEEIEANQLELDSAIESITRISNTASFAGLPLLNGSMDYITSSVDNTKIDSANVKGAHFGSYDKIPVDVEILTSAQPAQIRFTADYAGTTEDGTLLSSVTLEIAGNDGVQVLSFTSGTTMSEVIRAVNLLKDSTGVSASLVSASNESSGIFLASTTFGSDAFVSVERRGTEGAFWEGNVSGRRDEGQDVVGLVNGALATGDGLSLSVKTPTLSLDLDLTQAFATNVGGTETFYVTGGGATFQLGPEVKANQQINFGIPSIAASRIGGVNISDEMMYLNSLVNGGDNSLHSGNFEAASKIIDAAIDEIAVLRGSLGAIERNTLDTNIRSLQVSLENITASESKIRDTDFAIETSEMTRAQILVQSGTSVLATANSNSQTVLQLLG